MSADEIATKFLLGIRHSQLAGDTNVEDWKVMGCTVLRRGGALANEALGRPADFGSPAQVMDWPGGPQAEFLAAVSPLVTRDPEVDHRIYLVPTLGEVREALLRTGSNDLSVICDAIGLDARDEQIARVVWATTTRFPLHATRGRPRIPAISEADYIALRSAARQADIGYVMALLDAGLPAPAVTQLCALPPMPMDYAIAMLDGGAV
jgi:hypothetical protein